MSALTGTRTLVRFALRRDRVRLPTWIAAITALMAVSAASVVGLYTTEAELLTYSRLVQGNAAMVVQAGPGFGLDEPTTGAIVVNEALLWGVVAVGLMGVFAVARHTRAEEETGRAELLRATVVGRDAPAAATAVVVALADLAVGALVALALVVLGLPVAGSIALGAALAAAGAVFAAVTAVAAQVTTTARGAIGIGVGAIGVSFVLRAIGDVRGGPLSWFSPIGWAHRVRPFADEQWWVLGLAVAVAAALTGLAFALTARRDLGAGLLSEQPGPAEPAEWLLSPLGLAVRLQRGALIGWVSGLAVLGAFYGVVGDEAEQMIADNPDLADFFAQLGSGSVVDAFFATGLLMLALMASGFTVSSVLRLRSEETAGRADPLLAGVVPRRRWMASHLVVALVGSLLVVGAGGVGAGAGYAIVTGDASQVARLLGAALVHLPAVAVLGALTVALFGLIPRWALLGWAGVAVAVVVGIFGELLQLPDAVRAVSPFEHAPALPAAELDLMPLAVTAAVALALGAAGFLGFRARDVDL
ncbi:MAG TPA: hypothetical protein VK866_11795 [Acidimicrobiales bacterium]|nr:hypothetical protein [Acidimicrobiales bacterium]